MSPLFLLLLLPLGLAVAVYLEASGATQSRVEPAEGRSVDADPEGLDEVEALIRQEFHERPRAMMADGATRAELMADKRRFFDALGTEREFDAEFREIVIPTPGFELPGEWTLVDGHDPDRRLLYLHGGAFAVGSPRSHRSITVALAKATGAAVFAPDYRLMPENKRLDGIADARATYVWLADHAPEGARSARELFVAGDSAGGSLTLMVAQWARDEGLRQADALVTFSPFTDYTLRAESLRSNHATDITLQPLFQQLMTLKRPVLMAGLWKAMSMRPSDPRNSPLFGDLAGLPPTLVQVSADEMLLDDARNYAARAMAAGSEVELEVWRAEGDAPLPHVWQMFDRELPAARASLERAGQWLLGQVSG